VSVFGMCVSFGMCASCIGPPLVLDRGPNAAASQASRAAKNYKPTARGLLVKLGGEQGQGL
jgi:hypothetical protein